MKFFERKERWGLTWRGWLLAGLLAMVVGSGVFWRIQPFLAISEPVPCRILVVEGWVDWLTIGAAVEEFHSGGYTRVLTTGGPVVGNGDYVNDFQTCASVGADRLRKSGLPAEKVQMVPCRKMARDRTFASAVALRDWFKSENLPMENFNVLTEDVHARRTQILYQKAFSADHNDDGEGKEIQIGIISVPDPDYPAEEWWKYSQGVKDVFGEVLAYVYTKLFFDGDN
ncbi:MAG: ElyC/SanA/YdcF family protein [Verrucomicrobiales bacterium]